MQQLETSVWTNWYQNLSRTAFVVDAGSEEEIAEAVAFAHARNLSVRIAGTGHSNIALVPTSGMVITTDKLHGLLAHDSEAKTVKLAAGTKIRKIGDMLWEHGLSLTNQGDIDTQSIAGAISTGTHGTGISLTNLSSRVRSLRLVTAMGELCELGQENEETMRAARVSMGMLGAVTSVEMEVSAAYHLHEWVGFMPYELAAEIEDQMNAHYRHFTYFWCADGRGADWLGFPNAIPEGGKSYACVRIFDPNPISLGELEKYTWRRRHDRSYRIFAEDYRPEFDEMEYMVPLELGRECFEELINCLRPVFEELAIPTEVRVTAGDDNYLSEYFGGPRRAISLAGRMHADNTELFDRCDAVFARYQGRTHWGKANRMTRERLRGLYPRFDDFISVRRAMDPDGLFLNDYLRPWFA